MNHIRTRQDSSSALSANSLLTCDAQRQMCYEHRVVNVMLCRNIMCCVLGCVWGTLFVVQVLMLISSQAASALVSSFSHFLLNKSSWNISE